MKTLSALSNPNIVQKQLTVTQFLEKSFGPKNENNDSQNTITESCQKLLQNLLKENQPHKPSRVNVNDKDDEDDQIIDVESIHNEEPKTASRTFSIDSLLK